MKRTILTLLMVPLLLVGCDPDDPMGDDFYRQEMRAFVTNLGNYAKGIDPNFIIIPQNGQELVTDTGEGDGTAKTAYLQSIDATGRESMFYGYDDDDVATPLDDQTHMLDLCLLCEQYGVEVLATDYCWTQGKVDNSYLVNAQNGFISFAADERNLNNIPGYPAAPNNVNSDDITLISQATNFLYLINSENFATKQNFINAVAATNFDVIIMDLYHNEVAYTANEINALKTKQNGGTRMVIAYMSIGEAEDYRAYWQSSWDSNPPQWLGAENPVWAGNYKVDYWDSGWQAIIFGNGSSYLKKILDAGFNGVYLDLVDAFEYFEE